MDLSRRAIIKAGVVGAVACSAPVQLLGLAGASRAGAATLGGTAGLETLTMASFVPHVSTPFRFQLGGGRSTVMPLVQVVNQLTGTTKPSAAPRGESFSLVFAGTHRAFPQGTYTVEHARLGRLQLFVAPVDRRANGQDYQAVFNRTTG